MTKRSLFFHLDFPYIVWCRIPSLLLICLVSRFPGTSNAPNPPPVRLSSTCPPASGRDGHTCHAAVVPVAWFLSPLPRHSCRRASHAPPSQRPRHPHRPRRSRRRRPGPWGSPCLFSSSVHVAPALLGVLGVAAAVLVLRLTRSLGLPTPFSPNVHFVLTVLCAVLVIVAALDPRRQRGPWGFLRPSPPTSILFSPSSPLSSSGFHALNKPTDAAELFPPNNVRAEGSRGTTH